MDPRFDYPLFTPSQVAEYLDVPRSTFRGWVGQPVTHMSEHQGLSIPFVGLLEGYVVQQLRLAGIPLGEIRDANATLRDELQVNHPLVWQDLAHNGREILRRVDKKWERARDRQEGIAGAIEIGLVREVSWGDDKYPLQLRLRSYGCEVIVDPRLAGGHPIHSDTGVRVEDILNMAAGDGVAVTSAELGISTQDIEALQAAMHRRGTRTAA